MPIPRIVLCTLLAAGTMMGDGSAGTSTQWVTYHANLSRTGVDANEPSLKPIGVAWSNTLDGASVYGQPIVAAGRVFVATEDDDVYALDAHDGHVLWHVSIGTPFENVNHYVCGDISPLGITSTPAIDISRSIVYVAGETATGPAGSPPLEFRLVGFDMTTGVVVVNANAAPALPAGERLLYLQQRSALAIANGRVYVSYGGHFGDCGNYHGWVVGVNETGSGPTVQFDTTPQSTGGALWNGGGGPSVDSGGHVYVVTGNPTSSAPAPWAEAVVKLDANLDTPPMAAFQDPKATGDEDLGVGDAVLLPGGDLFVVGKTQTGYLLSQAALHQVHPIAGVVCGSDPDGGAAYDEATNSVYVPCRGGGIQQVDLTTHGIGWKAGKVNGAPILVDGNLWSVRYNSGLVQELSASSGAQIQSIQLPRSVPNFVSPSSADGLLLIGTTAGVVALDGPSGPPPPAPLP